VTKFYRDVRKNVIKRDIVICLAIYFSSHMYMPNKKDDVIGNKVVGDAHEQRDSCASKAAAIDHSQLLPWQLESLSRSLYH